ncbi:MAG: YcgN family cysteine cluster protein [Alphaproteobacteria bacterium]
MSRNAVPSNSDKPFWQTKRLDEMSNAEWESICDGCGQCCLHKIEDPDSNLFICTNIACKLLDLSTARCKDYANRKQKVPDCVQLTPDMVAGLGWLPETCGYRLISEGKPLADWHPLMSHHPASVIAAGHSICGRAISESLYPDADTAIDIWMREGNAPLWVQEGKPG